MTQLIALICGTLFGIGLAISGMTDTHKVQGFLDLFGAWDPALVFVMGGAVVTTFIGFHFVQKLTRPTFADKFSLPTNTSIDKPLLIGAALFGIGWGLYGYCPGPAIASLAYFRPESAVFVVAMVTGMWVEKLWRERSI
ncbi:transporter [Hahella sp. CCB-MM4]|uniref:DUF6691 family protein n=1 Tax=Hahella sp. (strain CCB-MM4) TaxID=1926491 RepID=UPI000B9AEC87|nr:DUF6691 family protein [Hahella sp. CCB-MM4]OZG73112.1 transporter [Hahella sp. CCB-MM4]